LQEFEHTVSKSRTSPACFLVHHLFPPCCFCSPPRQHFFGRESAAKTSFFLARRETGLRTELTGALGRRTKFQTFDTAQVSELDGRGLSSNKGPRIFSPTTGAAHPLPSPPRTLRCTCSSCCERRPQARRLLPPSLMQCAHASWGLRRDATVLKLWSNLDFWHPNSSPRPSIPRPLLLFLLLLLNLVLLLFLLSHRPRPA
jgi:hypothetical protein